MAIDLQSKYLVQDISEGSSFSVYDQYLLASTNDRKFVIPGKGLEITYKNQLGVQSASKTSFIPSERHDLPDYIMSDTLDFASLDTADAGVVDINLDESEWLYPSYFLSGKLEEQYEKIKSALAPTMRKYEFHLLIGLHAQIAKALGDITDPTKWTDATGPVVPKNPYIVDTRATTQIPAIADLQLAINYMTMDNTWSAYGPYMETAKPLPTGRYVNTSMENLAIICNPTLKAYIQSNLHNWSVRDKQKFDKFIEQFIAYPVQYVNPLDNTMKSLNFLNNNQVLIIEKKYVDRIYNYAKELSQYFAQNDTVRYVNKLREVVGAYKFTSVCLFECDGLLKVVEPYAPA